MSTHPAYKLTTTDIHILWAVQELQGFGGWAAHDPIVERVQQTMSPGIRPGNVRYALAGLVRSGYLITNASGWQIGNRR